MSADMKTDRWGRVGKWVAVGALLALPVLVVSDWSEIRWFGVEVARKADR